MDTLGGSDAHEAIDVGTCAPSLRGHADDCVRQVGRVLGLGCMNAAVLPNVLEPKPGPHHAAPATNVSTWHHGERHNRRANLLFAVINPSVPYWAFGFPSACLIVLAADFTFASGTLFIAKISPPHEQSVAGALFQAVTEIV